MSLQPTSAGMTETETGAPLFGALEAALVLLAGSTMA